MAREHGTLACYTFGPNPGGDHRNGCRCRPCRDAKNAYELNRQRMQNRPDMVWMPYVPAGRARRHVRWLSTQGVGLKTIVKRSGVSQGSLWKLMYGKKDAAGRMVPSKRVRPETEAKILAVTPDAAADGARVDGAATWQLIDDLLARGFYRSWLARQLDVLVSNLYRRGPQVSAGFARRVAALHRRCEGVTAPRKRSRRDVRRAA